MKRTRVKFSSSANGFPFLRQTPCSAGIWENFEFHYEDSVEECDWWVVYEGLDRQERTVCDPDRTIFVMGEPPSAKTYNPDFLHQFRYIWGARDFGRAPRRVQYQPALPYHAGWSPSGDTHDYPADYDQWIALNEAPPKEKLLSVVISNKSFTREHRRRQEFVRRLQAEFGDQIDVFGRGIRDIADKWEALAPYRYHLVLENSIYPHYWSEKLADAYLGWSFPIYSGCPNICDYFEKDELLAIDIKQPRNAIRAIRDLLETDESEAVIRSAALARARDRLLNQYNLFPEIVRMIGLFSKESSSQARPLELKPEYEFQSIAHRLRTRAHRFYHYWF